MRNLITLAILCAALTGCGTAPQLHTTPPSSPNEVTFRATFHMTSVGSFVTIEELVGHGQWLELHRQFYKDCTTKTCDVIVEKAGDKFRFNLPPDALNNPQLSHSDASVHFNDSPAHVNGVGSVKDARDDGGRFRVTFELPY